MRRVLAAYVLAAAVFAAACGDSTGPEDRPTVDGRWTATIVTPPDPDVLDFDLDLVQESGTGRIFGQGTLGLTGASARLTVTVTGQHAHPQVTMVLAIPAIQESLSFTGQLRNDGDELVGTMGTASVTFTRRQ